MDPYKTNGSSPPPGSADKQLGSKKRTPEQIHRMNSSPAGRAAKKRYKTKVQLAKAITRAERLVEQGKSLLGEQVAP